MWWDYKKIGKLKNKLDKLEDKVLYIEKHIPCPDSAVNEKIEILKNKCDEFQSYINTRCDSLENKYADLKSITKSEFDFQTFLTKQIFEIFSMIDNTEQKFKYLQSLISIIDEKIEIKKEWSDIL